MQGSITSRNVKGLFYDRERGKFCSLFDRCVCREDLSQGTEKEDTPWI